METNNDCFLRHVTDLRPRREEVVHGLPPETSENDIDESPRVTYAAGGGDEATRRSVIETFRPFKFNDYIMDEESYDSGEDVD